ncbi:MAG: MarR family transcriptional regulator [Anaerolineae bacterium]|nr:MarR family transcriptional regulator [Anaerolineae bacterium]NUQ07174.1 MarR family transcriptional regulator [Anaerolineae bacterium]
MPSANSDTTALAADVERLWTMLFQLVLDAEKHIAGQLAQHGLTTPQFYVLKTLIEHGGSCPIGEIAHLHGLTNPTMTGLVGRMEASDPPLVTRIKHLEDKRSVNVVLTDAGRERFLAVQQRLFEQLRHLFSLLDSETRASLMAELDRYIDVIRSAIAQ